MQGNLRLLYRQKDKLTARVETRVSHSGLPKGIIIRTVRVTATTKEYRKGSLSFVLRSNRHAAAVFDAPGEGPAVLPSGHAHHNIQAPG